MGARVDEKKITANCLCYILTIYCICIPFQFLRCGIRMQIPILTMVQKGVTTGWKIVMFY